MGPGVLEDQRLRAIPDLDLAERPRVGQTPAATRPGSAMRRSTTASAPATTRALQRICDRLGPGRCSSFFWRWCHRLPSPFTPPTCAAGYLRARLPPVRGVRHPGVRPPRSRPGLLRGPHPRPPRHRPPRPGGHHLRPAGHARTPGAFRTKVVTRGRRPPAVLLLQVPAGSSSTSRSTGHCAPRRSSATPATSGSGGASAARTGMPCGPLAKPPTASVRRASRRRPSRPRRGHLRRGDLAVARRPTACTPPACASATAGHGGPGRHSSASPT